MRNRVGAWVVILTIVAVSPLLAQEPARVEIALERVEAAIGDSVHLEGTAYDEAGNPLDVGIRWLTSYEIGTTRDDWFIATNSGEANIIAVAGQANAAIPVVVRPLPPTRLELTLPSAVTATSWLPLTAEAYDRLDGRVFDAQIEWSTVDSDIAYVVAGHLVTEGTGSVTVIARSGSATTRATVVITDAPAGMLATDTPDGAIRTGDVYRLSPTVHDRRLPDGAYPRYSVRGPRGSIDADGAFVAEEPGDYIVFTEFGEQTVVTPIKVEARGFDKRLDFVGRGAVSYAHTGDLWVFRNAGYVGNYWDNSLRVFDISDPANPVMTDSIVVDARRVNDVKVNEEGRFAIMTREGASDRRNGIVVLDISDPLHPTVVSEYTETLTGGVHNVFIVGDLVYAVHNGTSDLHIIDVSDRENPRQVGRWGLDKINKVLHDVFIKDGIAYLSYWDDGLVILDVGGAERGGTPTEPQFVSRFYYPEGNTHVAWRWKNYVFVGDEFFPPGWDPDKPIAASGYIHVIDVSDLDHPVEVAKYEVPEAGAHNVWIEDDDDNLYIGYYQAGIRVVDVSGELRGDLYRQGRQIDYYLTRADENVKVPNAPFNWGVMLHNGLIFSADFNSGLWIHKWVPTGDRPIS